MDQRRRKLKAIRRLFCNPYATIRSDAQSEFHEEQQASFISPFHCVVLLHPQWQCKKTSRNRKKEEDAPPFPFPKAISVPVAINHQTKKSFAPSAKSFIPEPHATHIHPSEKKIEETSQPRTACRKRRTASRRRRLREEGEIFRGWSVCVVLRGRGMPRVRLWVGELLRYRCVSFSNVSALRCIYACLLATIPCCCVSIVLLPVALPPVRRGYPAERSAKCRLREGSRMCVPDGVTSAKTDPLWDRSVLLLGSGELHFRAEGLVALHTQSHQYLSIQYTIVIAPHSTSAAVAQPVLHYQIQHMQQID